MGRMLETLRQAESPTPPPEGPTPPLHAVTADGATSADAEAAEPGAEVHFIEVGPRRSMEASPSVLACPASRTAAPAETVVAPSALLRHVAFRPLPARSRLAPELLAFHEPDGPAGVQYRELLAALLAAPRGRPAPAPQTLLFTAARPGTGTTTVLLNAGVTAARHGRRRVVVVDANPRRAAVAARLGLDDAPGVCEVLAGSATLGEALRETEQEGLEALTAGAVAPAAGPRFAAETTRSLLRQLRQRFDLVFVDGPAWDGRQELAALAAACDAVYLVLPEQEAETPQTDRLLQAIPAQGARLAGCVLADR